MIRCWTFLLVLTTIGGFTSAADDPPRAVSAWAAGPFEARASFDRPLAPSVAAGLVGTRIVFGDDVKAGDRYEPRKAGEPPPKTARGSLRIAAARLEDRGRTLVLATDPHSVDTTYAMIVSGVPVVYGLKGVQVTWDSGKGDAPVEWSGWLPTLKATANTLKDASKPGRVTLKTVAALPKGKSTIRGSALVPFELSLGNESANSVPNPKGGHSAEVAAEVEEGVDGLDLSVVAMVDGKVPPGFEATFADGRPIPGTALALPWAPPKPLSFPPAPMPSALLSGGDPTRGASIFKGDQAKCAACHKMRGEGGEVGPDLSDLVHRDRTWVYQNIAEPSATIHPDFLPYTLVLNDGRVLVGIVRAEGADAVKVIDTEAKATLVKKTEIEDLKPSTTSIMPVGLLGAVGEAGTKDLLSFLLSK